ncbi:MAG: hypothetical protein A2Y12_17940 [Planctomycetes bacterium GWF2_42_9]|nr:MAG: hypothetical protein A2Y12_17940 [Planctomycetes bacterium GWF2_42_9]
MSLAFKPDLNDAQDAFNHFWAREKWKRPLLCAAVPKAGSKPLPYDFDPMPLRYKRAIEGDWSTQFDCLNKWFQNTTFMAEAIPFFAPDFGPDQFAAFLGTQFYFSDSSQETNWVYPVLQNSSEYQIEFDVTNQTWQSVLEYTQRLAEFADGKFLVGVCDFHSNIDALSALRTPERLCMDFYDHPELVANAMISIRTIYNSIYDELYFAGINNNGKGTIGWAPFWCAGKFATIQSDFICMVSPEIARRFILPAIEAEAEFLDHSVFHLDGPGALRHLDNILAIKNIDVIQWVPGTGQKRMWEWLEILKKCREAGKGLHIYDIRPEEVKALHSELGPSGILYEIICSDASEVVELIKWLELNS